MFPILPVEIKKRVREQQCFQVTLLTGVHFTVTIKRIFFMFSSLFFSLSTALGSKIEKLLFATYLKNSAVAPPSQ